MLFPITDQKTTPNNSFPQEVTASESVGTEFTNLPKIDWSIELCGEALKHASVISWRPRFSLCISMERGPSVMWDSQNPNTGLPFTGP